MKFVKAVLIILLITPLGILNGGLRIYVTEPLLGVHIAMPLSGLIMSALVFLTAYVFIPKIGKCKTIEYIVIGTLWSLVANLFDLIITFLENGTISDFLRMFDVSTGNLWSLVVIVCFVSPIITAKIRRLPR